MDCKKCCEKKCSCGSNSIPILPPLGQNAEFCPTPNPCPDAFPIECVTYLDEDKLCGEDVVYESGDSVKDIVEKITDYFCNKLSSTVQVQGEGNVVGETNTLNFIAGPGVSIELQQELSGKVNVTITAEPVVLYKEYEALLTQNGIDNPEAVVLKNTFGAPIVWTRDSTGNYAGSLTGAFEDAKTFLLVGSPGGGDYYSNPHTAELRRVSANTVILHTELVGGSSIDSALRNTSVLIKVKI